ncbi:hypothetical protein MP638_001849 [Amoeboaphelidium occidentale]|nr:hypothetical protein MP638_001849 [Amoeboaphelidium occidentale]
MMMMKSYIVVLKDDADKTSLIKELKSKGIEIQHIYDSVLNGFSCLMTVEQKNELEKKKKNDESIIDYIEEDQTVTINK